MSTTRRWFSRGNRRSRKAPEPLDDPWHRKDGAPSTLLPEAPSAIEREIVQEEHHVQKPAKFVSKEGETQEDLNGSTDVLAAVEEPDTQRQQSVQWQQEEEQARFLERPNPTVESVRDSSLHDMASAKIAAYQGSSRSNQVMIPIAPGVSARLRGADETWKCIERDFYLPVVCFACTMEMCCIQDADFVICPMCRVVSPLDGSHASSPHLSNDWRAQREQTVGLGFTFEDLMKWQSEIVARRNGPTV